LLKQIFMIV